MKKYSLQTKERNFNISFAERTIGDTSMHIHTYYELELVLSGSGSTTINGHCYPVSKGAVFFLTPADVHCYRTDESIKIMNLSFTPEVLEYSVLLEMLYPMDCRIVQADDSLSDTLIFYCRQINRITESAGLFAEKQISLLTTCLLIELTNAQPDKRPLSKKETSCLPVQQALWLMHAHFKENISLNSLAKQLGIPSSTLGKKFARYYGVSFKKSLIQIRLQYAKSLIIHTNESLTDIAFYSGFNSLSYFQKAFLKEFGLSPNILRKRERALAEEPR